MGEGLLAHVVLVVFHEQILLIFQSRCFLLTKIFVFEEEFGQVANLEKVSEVADGYFKTFHIVFHEQNGVQLFRFSKFGDIFKVFLDYSGDFDVKVREGALFEVAAEAVTEHYSLFFD